MSMFTGAQNVVVNGSSFVMKTDTPEKEKILRPLFAKVAQNAILNEGGRADEVRCYPGTREGVIGKIEKWMDGEGLRRSRMLWLSGPAGAGKSAIFQTLVERCRERELHAASFFFFRGDDTRNHAQPLVATLIYQLCCLYSALDDLLVKCLKADPLVCSAPIEKQFKQLFSSPIGVYALQHSESVHHPLFLIIDGLDECDDERMQERVLAALHALVKEENSPFLILVASRAEPNLVMSFNKIRIEVNVESMFLDNEYRPQDDIRRFVVAKFDEIKKVHHLAHTLDKNWPAEANINAITNKSSGQFIYAATIMRFIQYSTASPAVSLQRVHGIQPAANHSPFAQLDAIYSHIFSKAHNIQMVKFVLGAHFIIKRGSPTATIRYAQFSHFLQLVGYKAIEIESFLADIVAIVKVDPHPPIQLVFYHASLTQYLFDKSRSGSYCLDLEEIALELSSICLKRSHSLGSWIQGASILLRVSQPTPDLAKLLLVASEQKLKRTSSALSSLTSDVWEALMKKIYELYFVSDKVLYQRILQSWMHFAEINNINMKLGITDTASPINWYLLAEGFKSALRS